MDQDSPYQNPVVATIVIVVVALILLIVLAVSWGSSNDSGSGGGSNGGGNNGNADGADHSFHLVEELSELKVKHDKLQKKWKKAREELVHCQSQSETKETLLEQIQKPSHQRPPAQDDIPPVKIYHQHEDPEIHETSFSLSSDFSSPGRSPPKKSVPTVLITDTD